MLLPSRNHKIKEGVMLGRADYSSNGLDGAGNTTARPERKA